MLVRQKYAESKWRLMKGVNWKDSDREEGRCDPALRRVVYCFRNEGNGAVVPVESAFVIAEAGAERRAENDLRGGVKHGGATLM